MFRICIKNFRSKIKIRAATERKFNSSPATQQQLKVAILGAAGHCGQTTSLLLKLSPHIQELALYDVEPTNSMAQELNLIDTNCKVVPYPGQIKDALKNAKIVCIVASVANKAPKMYGDCASEDNFQANALITCTLMNAVAQYCPEALVAIATNPINSIVPVAAEIMKKYGVFNPCHLFGITSHDSMRASALVAQCHGLKPESVSVPVIGGATAATKVPILSLTKPATEFSYDEIVNITKAIQQSPIEISEKLRTTSPYLSASASIAQFIISLIRGIKGEQAVVEYCYVPYNDFPHTGYFSTPTVLSINGAQRSQGIPKLSDYEYCLFLNAVEYLKKDVKLGACFMCCKDKKPPKQPLTCCPQC